jgi:hypothetical protein
MVNTGVWRRSATDCSARQARCVPSILGCYISADRCFGARVQIIAHVRLWYLYYQSHQCKTNNLELAGSPAAAVLHR